MRVQSLTGGGVLRTYLRLRLSAGTAHVDAIASTRGIQVNERSIGSLSRSASRRPDLAAATHNVFEAGELLDADRAARVQLAGGDADLAAETKLAAVCELGRRVVQHDG